MTPVDEPGDFLLIDETLQGRVRSFGALVEKYQDTLYTFVARSIGNREDAKDITQAVFINAFTNLKKFRKESAFSTWLYRIAVNQVKNHWRDKKNRLVVAESELRAFVAENRNAVRETTDAIHDLEAEELKRVVDDLISFLPPEQKQFFVLYYIAGHTCREIADIFKTSASNVKIQLYRGRQALYGRFKNLFK
jgi:RNA polymerase sigma factor (sigma-70 family)